MVQLPTVRQEARIPLTPPANVQHLRLESSSSPGLSSGRVAVWDVDIENWLKRACEVANRNLTREEWLNFVGDELPYMPVCPALPYPKD